MGDEEAPVRTERARFLSAGEESEVRTGADFLAGEISVLTIPHPSPLRGNSNAYLGLFENEKG
jgi:hypothetical protein